MKLLIWLGCILVASIFQTFLQMKVGVDSPLLIFLAMMAAARHFCKKWDNRHSTDKEETKENIVLESQDEQVFSDSTEEHVQEKAIGIQTSAEVENIPTDDSEEVYLDEKLHVMENSSSPNPFDVLKQLNELHNEGILTDEEYSEKKKEILNRI